MLNEAAGDSVESVDSLREQFRKAEATVVELLNLNISVPENKERFDESRKILEELTRDVSALGLFSDNEIIDELPTESLQFLLLPAFLGFIHGNTCIDIEKRLDELKKAKIYYKDFLKRVKEYEIIQLDLWWLEKDELSESGTSSSTAKSVPVNHSREEKIKRYKLQKELEDKMKLLTLNQKSGKLDEADTRDLYMSQLKFWATKIYEELQSVESELPLMEQMLLRRTQRIPQEEKQKPPAPKPLQTFTITRDQTQKKVFGLGYPSIPTMTVDEWYNSRFGSHHGNQPGPSTGSSAHDNHDDCSSKGSESDDSDSEEAKRQEAIRMDEYKDTHRRGWGNTHNKG